MKGTTSERPTRRGFIRLLSAAVAGLLTLPASLARAKKVALPLAKLPKLQAVGGWIVLKIKGNEVLLVRDTERTVHALNPTCTHKKCRVSYTHGDRKFHCECHKSAYALDGRVLDGPAPKPLQVYPAKLAGDRIILSLPDRK